MTRQYVNAEILRTRIVNMKHLWEGAVEYQGRPMNKPNFFGTFILPKTVPEWWQEPVLAGVVSASEKLGASTRITDFPVKDGDVSVTPGKSSPEWTRGQWVFTASTSNKPRISIVMADGSIETLSRHADVKPGDHCSVGLTLAIKTNNAQGIKFYLNTVLFTAPGDEIAVGNFVTAAELMAAAQKQGIRAIGFNRVELPVLSVAPAFPWK